MFRVGRTITLSFYAVAACIVGAIPVSAGDPGQHGATAPTRPDRLEAWFGVTALPGSWSTYNGVTLSPGGSISQDGLRIRIVGGHGTYDYDATADGRRTRRTTAYTFGDVLVGFQKQFGVMTAKVFAGGTVNTQTVEPRDPATDNLSEYGVKGALETWFNLGTHSFAKVDVNAGYYFDQAEAFEDVTVRAATGMRVLPNWQTGVEGGYLVKRQYEAVEGGLFARYFWAGTALTVSGGVSHDETETGGYARASFYLKY